MATATPITIVSLGKCAEILQAGPATIAKAAESAGVQPAYVINGIQHFAESDLPAIRQQIEGKR
jgi:hypothetical protein